MFLRNIAILAAGLAIFAIGSIVSIAIRAGRILYRSR